MSKALIAAKMNAQDNLMKGKKVERNSNGTRRTYKLIEGERPDINLIETPDGKVIGHLLKGTGTRWQLIPADCMGFSNFDVKPKLATCLSILGVK